MYVVTGVTGNTGRAVAETLLARGAKLRVVVRDAAKGTPWAERGAEVAVAEFTDIAALVRAFAGAEGVYAMTPPEATAPDMLAARDPMNRALAQAARQAGVPHVVLLSSIGAQHAAGTGPIKSLHRLEAEFRGLGVKVTALRAAYFLENWGGVLPVAKAQGVLPAFIALDRRIPMVATADIGRAAAEALLSPPAEAWRTIELSGAADLSPNDIAAAVSERLGRGVPAVAVPREAWEGTLTGAGLSADAARQFAEMFEGIDSGHVAFDGTGTPQRGATDFKALLGALLG